MEELFKNLEPPFDGYKISNFGRIINAKGKECKPRLHIAKKNGVNYCYPYVNINIRKKRIKARKFSSLAQEVYKAFGDGYKDGAKVFHKDGDEMNCKIDNLFIVKGYTTAPDQEQIAKYENETKSVILHFVGAKKYNEYSGLDVDNIIGNSYLLVWQHLSQYKTGTSFYSFCARYIKWAFLYEYKKYKNRIEHCLSYEELQEEK